MVVKTPRPWRWGNILLPLCVYLPFCFAFALPLIIFPFPYLGLLLNFFEDSLTDGKGLLPMWRWNCNHWNPNGKLARRIAGVTYRLKVLRWVLYRDDGVSNTGSQKGRLCGEFVDRVPNKQNPSHDGRYRTLSWLQFWSRLGILDVLPSFLWMINLNPVINNAPCQTLERVACCAYWPW